MSDPFPTRDEVFYGRAVWLMGEDGDLGVMAEGHGRRALAAINAHERRGRSLPRWASLDGYDGATETWVRLIESCGCTPEAHAEHVAAAEEDPVGGYIDCDCDHFGLPPCRDIYDWSSEPSAEGEPGAVPVTVATW